jgi:charged multivesicular body protein 5
MEDLIEQSNEIQESLGRTYGVPDEVDEADLEAGGWRRISFTHITILKLCHLHSQNWKRSATIC